jgi:hypothetical protein
LAYNPKDGLHKCAFRSDHTEQWLNLKKKPVRGFAQEDEGSMEEGDNEEEFED